MIFSVKYLFNFHITFDLIGCSTRMRSERMSGGKVGGSGKWINENKSNDTPPDIIEIDDISDNTTHFALYNRSRRMV